MKKIIDFIKSWLYYPKLEKYFEQKNQNGINVWRNKRFSALKYAWWHCHVGKMK